MGRKGEVERVLLLFAEAGDWDNDLVGGWMRSEERMAAGSLYIAQRRYIPEPDMIDTNQIFDVGFIRRKDIRGLSVT